MRFKSHDGSNVLVEIPIAELKALLGVVLEALEGPYALSNEEWDEVSAHPRELDEHLSEDLHQIVVAYESQQ